MVIIFCDIDCFGMLFVFISVILQKDGKLYVFIYNVLDYIVYNCEVFVLWLINDGYSFIFFDGL